MFSIADDWNFTTVERYQGIHYVTAQITGLLIKRFHRTKRNVKGFIAEILLPIIFVFLAMLVTKLAPNESEPPALILHPWYWSRPNYIFQSLPIASTSSLSKAIERTYGQSPSLGTRCMKSTDFNRKVYPCDTNGIGIVNLSTSFDVMQELNRVDYNRTRISPTCDCWEKMQTCPIGGGGPTANYRLTETKDILYDLQDFNITDWFVDIYCLNR
jgi:ATP-binding cassette, subfamily A (ABC1), member 1